MAYRRQFDSSEALRTRIGLSSSLRLRVPERALEEWGAGVEDLAQRLFHVGSLRRWGRTARERAATCRLDVAVDSGTSADVASDDSGRLDGSRLDHGAVRRSARPVRSPATDRLDRGALSRRASCRRARTAVRRPGSRRRRAASCVRRAAPNHAEARARRRAGGRGRLASAPRSRRAPPATPGAAWTGTAASRSRARRIPGARRAAGTAFRCRSDHFGPEFMTGGSAPRVHTPARTCVPLTISGTRSTRGT